ncbi:MAG TPA: prolipoprotein diacylglyceryl transferase [Candidatus Sulfomarinibacteraceae bacterium]|nr:prolipoprotein diacylglyceryl transferase [Candidatus Sulfomarinibacteraceae bacterium]
MGLLVKNRSRLTEVQPYWYPITLFLLVASALYVYHIFTGFTPDRVAIAIEALQFNIYWYGLIITGGIALGSYVVVRLAHEQARRVLKEEVPPNMRSRPVDRLDLPEEIVEVLADNDVKRMGDLLLYLGFGADGLPLNSEGRDVVRQTLAVQSGIDARWLENPRWAQWNPYHVWNGLIWCLIFAVIGARLYHVLTPSPSMAEVGITSPADYFRNPLQLINLRRGGLGIYGGIAGGALGLLIYAYRTRISWLGWADLAVVGVALGQFVGRWGNFINQELYGRPSSAPWAVWIEPAYRLDGYEQFTRFHPAFLYESLWNLLAFVILLTLVRRFHARLFRGDVMAAYLILYAVGRTLLETVRLDSRQLELGAVQLPVATLVSIVIALGMASWIYVRHQRAGNGR